MSKVCDCGKGYASEVDNLCKFCREHQLSRAEGKKAGVRHRGDGLSLFDMQKHMTKRGYEYPDKGAKQ